MAYAPGITLRPWTVGGTTTTEAGEALFTRAKITASRSLMLWGATGWRYESSTKTITSTEGAQVSGDLPVCDQPGWRTEGNAIIDVSVPGSYTHTYTIKVSQFRKDASGREIPVGEERTYANVYIPTGDLSPFDLDLMQPVATVAGGVVLVPGSWDARVAAAEAAALQVSTFDGRLDALEQDVVVEPSGDTSGVTDLAALEAAAAAATLAGRPVRLAAGTFYINAPWDLPQQVAVLGAPVLEEWVGDPADAHYANRPGEKGPSSEALYGYPFAGTIITQVTAGEDVITCTARMHSHHLADIVVTWSAALLNVNTGNGFMFATDETYLSEPDHGSYGSTYERLISWGHDGDHYGFYWLNSLYNKGVQCRSYGGGGFRIRGEHAIVATGNFTYDQFYAYVVTDGAANGIQIERMGENEGGALTHMTWIRPQVNMGSGSTTQKGWNDLGGDYYPNQTVIFGLDLENCAGNVFGPYTEAIGFPFVESAKTAEHGRYNASYYNTAYGREALGLATTTAYNAAFGFQALRSLTTNGQGTALGYQAGKACTALGITAVGYLALAANTTGTGNTALGRRALAANVSNSNNTAVGHDALAAVTASSNTALGFSAGAALTSGDSNCLLGTQALLSGVGAKNNVAIGKQAGYATTPTAVAANATVSGERNVFVGNLSGASSAADPSRTVALGYAATVGSQYAVAIGYNVSATASGSVAIGTDTSGTPASATSADTIALGTGAHTTKIAGRLNVAQRTPTSTADPQGQVGDIATDDNYVYVKTSAGWKRSALSTF